MSADAIDAAKTVPAISGAVYAGLSLNEWVAIATLLYTLAQLGLLLPKYWALARAKGWVK